MPTIASVTVTFSRKYQLRKDNWIGLEATITMRVDEAEADQTDPQSVTAEAFFYVKAAVLDQQDAIRRELAAARSRATDAQAILQSADQPTALAPAATPPATVAEAAARFYARYGDIIGAGGWAAVQRYTGIRAAEPTTIKGWYAAAQACRDRMDQDAGR
jgi:hypothetical protein